MRILNSRVLSCVLLYFLFKLCGLSNQVSSGESLTALCYPQLVEDLVAAIHGSSYFQRLGTLIIRSSQRYALPRIMTPDAGYDLLSNKVRLNSIDIGGIQGILSLLPHFQQ